MTLSVIIVNYNVKHFLEQCLHSVLQAFDFAQIEGEVIVVDNASSDGSTDYLKPRFHSIQIIANTENSGFSKANNQGLKIARGEYVLFLNPDTILPENCFAISLNYLRNQPKAGAMGVRMIDGGGTFLKESKRGFPTAWASFGRLSGLSKMFPGSKVFSSYYLGQLKEFENNEVDVIAGAFFLAKRELLVEAGGFDEQFFMYAEDIDLSYRIQQMGLRNLYLAECTIIHFKGESTRKDSRYIRHFYKAMSQFVDKHTRKNNSVLAVPLLKAAIWLRAGIASLVRQHSYSREPASFFLKGDPEGIQSLRSRIKKNLVDKEESGEAKILVQGKDFSFEKIIKEIQSHSGIKHLIHSSGSGSVVGSFRNSENGVVIPLESN